MRSFTDVANMLSLRLGTLLCAVTLTAALPMLPLDGSLAGGLDHLVGGKELPPTHLSLGPTPLAAPVNRPAPEAVRPAVDDDPLALTLGTSKRPAQTTVGPARWRRKTEPEPLTAAPQPDHVQNHEPLPAADPRLLQFHQQGRTPAVVQSPLRRPTSHPSTSAASTTARHPPYGPPATPRGEGPSSSPVTLPVTSAPPSGVPGHLSSLRRGHGEPKELHEERILAAAKRNHREWQEGRVSFDNIAHPRGHKEYLQTLAKVHMTKEIHKFEGDEQLKQALQRTVSPHTGIVETKNVWRLRYNQNYQRYLDETHPEKFVERGDPKRDRLAWQLERMRNGQPILPFKSGMAAQKARPVESSASS